MGVPSEYGGGCFKVTSLFLLYAQSLSRVGSGRPLFTALGCIIKKGGARVATPLAKHRQVSLVMFLAALPAHVTSSIHSPESREALILTSTLHLPSTARRSPGGRVSASRRGHPLRPLKLGHRRRRLHGGGCRPMAEAGTFTMTRVA